MQEQEEEEEELHLKSLYNKMSCVIKIKNRNHLLKGSMRVH